MKLKEFSSNSPGTGIVSSLCAVLGLVLVVSAAVRIGDRLWAHLENRLWSVPGAAPLVVLAAGALLSGVCLHVLRRHGRRAVTEGVR
jgi:ABC-type Fe3+ transport system permease subunit